MTLTREKRPHATVAVGAVGAVAGAVVVGVSVVSLRRLVVRDEYSFFVRGLDVEQLFRRPHPPPTQVRVTGGAPRARIAPRGASSAAVAAQRVKQVSAQNLLRDFFERRRFFFQPSLRAFLPPFSELGQLDRLALELPARPPVEPRRDVFVFRKRELTRRLADADVQVLVEERADVTRVAGGRSH